MFILLTAGLILAGWLTHSQTIFGVNSLNGNTNSTNGMLSKQTVACDLSSFDPNNPAGILACNSLVGTLMFLVVSIIGIVFVVGLIPGTGNLFSTVGFASIYILPAFLIITLVALEVFIFPLGFVMAASDFIKYPILLVYNSLLIATVVQVIKGS